MSKTKSRAVIKVADGAGGMVTVQDRRFEADNWPIQFEVPNDQKQADNWLRHLSAESQRRGWSVIGLGQIERAENSGSLTITAGPNTMLAVVWERRPGRSLGVRVRPETLSLTATRRFVNRVTDRCRAGETEQIYWRGTLQYVGRPWTGELWLDDSLRLGPPSRDDEPGLRNGARRIQVDALLDCIGRPDLPWVASQRFHDVAAFLSVIMGHAVEIERNGRAWRAM